MPKTENLDGPGPTTASGGDKPQTQMATPMTKHQKSTNVTSRYQSGALKKGPGALGGKNR